MLGSRWAILVPKDLSPELLLCKRCTCSHRWMLLTIMSLGYQDYMAV